MYKVRFHLGRGKNFMKWQVKYLGTEYGGDDKVSYVTPQDNQLAMLGCKPVSYTHLTLPTKRIV